MRRPRNGILLTLLALALTGGAPYRAVADERPVIPMAQYWARSELESMRLSPDVRRLAAIGAAVTGPVVLLIDAETLETRVIVRRSRSSVKLFASPSDVHWIDNDLLAVDFDQGVSEAVDTNGEHVSFLGSMFIGRRQKQGESSDWVLAYHDDRFEDIGWYLLDTATWRLREVAARVSAIDPKHMRTTEIVQYAARDGLGITGFVTRPSRTPATPAPMVVLIHGGPWVRDYWGYDPEVQMLAAQGYVVFQPEFRGSDGFGRHFKEAGYRQFGRAMQDDITDGVKYLVDQGIADRRRICIYGASYGGYAAMWGVINTPDLYRCGVSYAGVSDLVDQVSFSLLNDSTIASRELSRRMVGDPDTMRDQLKQVSPIEHAADVRVPLLVAHGERDQRVLFSQSRRFVERLRELGKDVEWMPIEGVGHGFGWTRDRMRFNAALLSFLQRHIGNDETASDSSKSATAASATETVSRSAPVSR